MKVKELKVLLETIPDDWEVIIQKDGEGNNYSPLDYFDNDAYVYIPENTWSGIVISQCALYDCYDFETEKEFKEYLSTGKECVVLAPIN